MRLGLFSAALSALPLVACSLGGAPDGVIDRCSESLALPAGAATDILFVIDDSVSMFQEQEKVAAQLEAFVTTLLEGPVENDFQVAVTTTGVTQHARGCDPDEPGSLLDFPDHGGRLQPAALPGEDPATAPRVLSFRDPDLLQRFAVLVRQGTEGSAQEMGLEAMRLALTPPLASSQGFPRPGARLLVVVVSDEDDCSDPTATALTLAPACSPASCTDDAQCGEEGTYCLSTPNAPDARFCVPNVCETTAGRALLEPVERYVELLRTLDDGTGSGRQREVFLAVIGPVDEAGTPARCSSATDEASGIGVRYREAVDAMGDHGLLASICADDYGPSLQRIAELVQAPHTLELRQRPPDGGLLVIRLDRADGTEVTCRNGDGFTFEQAVGSAPARVTLEGRCRLRHGDRIEVALFCAG